MLLPRHTISCLCPVKPTAISLRRYPHFTTSWSWDEGNANVVEYLNINTGPRIPRLVVTLQRIYHISVPKLAARRRQFLYWPPFSLPDNLIQAYFYSNTRIWFRCWQPPIFDSENGGQYRSCLCLVASFGDHSNTWGVIWILAISLERFRVWEAEKNHVNLTGHMSLQFSKRLYIRSIPV
jgi:hypothetical protein